MCRHDRLEVAPIAGFIGYPSKPAYVPGTSLGSLYDMQIRVPNISGSFGYDGYGLMNFGKGAFAMSTKQPKTFGEGQYYDSYDTSFSAKRSSSTYGAASTVQPSSMRLVPCIKA